LIVSKRNIIIMKAVLALCFVAVANAAVIPTIYTTGGAITTGLTTGITTGYRTGVLPYSAGIIPYTAGALPAVNYGVLPTTYVAPQTIQLQPVQTNVVAPGYVARTPGSEHVAPLPSGLGYASHHINLAKAPGTA